MKFSTNIRGTENDERGNETQEEKRGESVEIDVNQTIGEKQGGILREGEKEREDDQKIGSERKEGNSSSVSTNGHHKEGGREENKENHRKREYDSPKGAFPTLGEEEGVTAKVRE